MRKLMWFSIGFAAVCGLLAYGMDRLWLLAASGVLVIIAAAALAVCRKRSFLMPGIAVLTGVLLGLFWFGGYCHLYLRPVYDLDGEQVSLRITVSDYSYDTGWGTGVDGIVTLGGKPYQIRCYVDEETQLNPGDILEGVFRLGMTGGDGSGYLQGKGVFLRGYQQESLVITTGKEPPVWCYPALLRHRLLGILEVVFPEDTAPFARALLLGDSRGLDYETQTALAISGIRHVVGVN